MVKYLLHLPNGTTEIEAETVNLGQRKLWLYDVNDDLVAVFVWEKIVGFEVTGSARDQKFTDDCCKKRRR
jgi:hypothetical protein